MKLATSIFACSFRSFIFASCDNIDVSLASVPATSIEIEAEYSGTIFCSTKNINWMLFLIYVVPSKTITTRLYTNPSQIRPCRSHICMTSGIKSWILGTCFVSVLNFSASRCITQHFHGGFKEFSAINFGPIPVFTRRIVRCSTVFVRPTLSRTL